MIVCNLENSLISSCNVYQNHEIQAMFHQTDERETHYMPTIQRSECN